MIRRFASITFLKAVVYVHETLLLHEIQAASLFRMPDNIVLVSSIECVISHLHYIVVGVACVAGMDYSVRCFAGVEEWWRWSIQGRECLLGGISGREEGGGGLYRGMLDGLRVDVKGSFIEGLEKWTAAVVIMSLGI